MRLADYDYELPPELIAQTPADRRDASRLLVLDRTGESIRHARFSDLPAFLRPGDRLVVNDTRVIPGRLFGAREGHAGRVELLLTHPGEPRGAAPVWIALARPARKLLPGVVLRMGESAVPVRVLDVLDESRRAVAFPDGFDVLAFLQREGHVPLPPYIRREDAGEDRERYQTVYAARPGAVAAPTAGLHFTPELFARLEESGVARTALTLHVGPGTFRPVTAEDVREHVMDPEHYAASAEAAAAINATRRAGGRVVAVGTTVVRTLESLPAADEDPRVRGATGGDPRAVAAGEGWTRLFIHPPRRIERVDALVTNFHLPRSTLLMLVSAFAGREFVLRAYAEAVRERYRFYSYGDAMLIL